MSGSGGASHAGRQSAPRHATASTDGSPEPLPGTPVDERTSRLAELVTSLTGCPPSGALHVLRTDDEPADDALELVARAIIRVDAPPDPSLRIVGDLRAGDPAAPSDRSPGSPDQASGVRGSAAGVGSTADDTSVGADPSVGAGSEDAGDRGGDDRWRRSPWLDVSERASDDRRRDGRDAGPSAASTS